MKNQLSLKEAKRLSIIKWKFIVANGWPKHYELFPNELHPLGPFCFCGFCARWGYGKNNINAELCKRCEFGKIAGICSNNDSKHHQWGQKQETKYAKEILALIKSIPCPNSKKEKIKK